MTDMNLFGHFQAARQKRLSAMMAAGELPPGLDISRVTAEPPRDASHGDVTTNAAMVVAKPAGMAPKVLAEILAKRLAEQPDVRPPKSQDRASSICASRKPSGRKSWKPFSSWAMNYGRSELGKGIRTNVEYVSANPTGPLHVGHCRGAVFGDALGHLLESDGL